MDIFTNETQTFKERFPDALLKKEDITVIRQHTKQYILIGTKQGKLFQFDKENGLQAINIPSKLPYVREIVPIGEQYWLLLSNDLNEQNQWVLINQKGELINEFEVEDQKTWRIFGQKGQHSFLMTYQVDETQLAFFQFNDDGKIQDLGKNYLQPLDNWSKSIQYQDFIISNPTEQFYLLGLSGQLQLRDLASEQLIYQFRAEDGILNQTCTSIYFESPQKCWLTTSNGVFLIHWRELFFEKILYEAAFKPSVRGLLEIKHNNTELLIANTYKGSFEIDLRDNSHRQLDFVKNVSIPIIQDKNGFFWLGTAHELIRWNRQQNQVQSFPFPVPQPAYAPQSIIEIDGGLLFLTKRCIGFFDTKNEQFTIEMPESKTSKWFGEYNKNFRQTNTLYAFQKDKNGNIWCLTSDGLYEFDIENGLQNRRAKDEKASNYLPAHSFRHFHEDKKGVFWLATGDGGLIQWDRNAESKTYFQQFNTQNNFHTDVLYGIFEDKFGYLWSSSDNGLIQFDKKSHQFISYLPEDGVSAVDFNRASHFQSDDGKIYFGSLDGITAFYPKDFVHNLDSLPDVPLIISGFEQFDGATHSIQNRVKEIEATQKIVLQPTDRFFSISFLLENYTQPEKIRYAYRIKGFQNDWTESYENTIRAVGLPYGKYTLEIKGRLPNGRYSIHQIRLPIIVKRPFYLTGWFFAIGVLLLAFGIWSIYKWRVFQYKKQQQILKNLVTERTKTIQTQNEQLIKDKDTITKQAKQLQELDELKSRFFTNVSHEFRTPLSLILAPIRSVLKRQQLSNQDATRLRRAEQSSEELLRLVNELLDISKLDAGQLQLEENAISLYDLVQRIFVSFESQALYNDIDYSLEYQISDHLNIKVDAKKLETIIINLIANALKFTPKTGSITLRVVDQPNCIQISVADTGIGIHEADLPYIFNRFYQSDTQPKHNGTGIGLAICKEYAQLMNAELTVQSPYKDNKGTCFTFEFPKVVVTSSQEIHFSKKENHSPIFHQPPTTNHRILIVEDNLQLRQYLEEILQPFYEVQTVSNGLLALEQLEKSHFNLILSDVMMPEIDGFELLKKVKGHKNWHQIPFLMLTARKKTEDKMNALRIGVDDYLIKPFDDEELLVRIENLLKNYTERVAFNLQLPQIAEVSNQNNEWLLSLEQLVFKHLSDTNLTVDTLAEMQNISRTSFFNKVKKLTGLSPNQYLQEARMSQARTLLETRTVHSVKEVAYSVGFKNTKYFTQLFKKRFGELPSDLLKK